jgi:hypothetical protein
LPLEQDEIIQTAQGANVITVEQYFGAKPHTQAQTEAAESLLICVMLLLEELGWDYPIDPDTGTSISGMRGGAGDGGFRLPTATTGKDNSSHKEARAVDVYDPVEKLDQAITDDLLAKHNLYREAPSSTIGWAHLTTRAPASGHRTFQP